MKTISRTLIPILVAVVLFGLIKDGSVVFAKSCVGVITGGPEETVTSYCDDPERKKCIKTLKQHGDDSCGTQCQKTDCYLSGFPTTTAHQWYKGCDGDKCDEGEDWHYLGTYTANYVQFSTVPNSSCPCP